MVFINKLADHSHHDDLRVDDELVVQKLKLPTNATVTGLTVSHISGLSDSLGNLTIDESALLADVNTQIAGKADASSVYTQTELDTIHATFAPASTTYTKTQVDAGLTAKLDATTYSSGIIQKADVTDLTALQTTVSGKANQSDVDTSLALKADLSTVNTSLNTKLDTSVFNTQIATKADISSLQATNTTLTQKANQTDVDTALSAKADLSALNGTNTTLTTKANITDMNSALALKVDTTDFNDLTTTVNAKAPQTSLDTTNSDLGTLTASLSALATQVNNEEHLVQGVNAEIIIPQRALPYPPKNISIQAGNYGGADDSPTAWAYPFVVGLPLAEVNGLKRKDYGHGTYELGNMTAPANSWATMTLPLNVVATGVEAVQRSDGANPQTNAYPSSDGWKVYAWNDSNSTWVEMNMDNSKIEPDGNGTLPTTYREITGNTLSSNRYRVMLCEQQRLVSLFDGFRIYSKHESLPEINLHDLIESVVELNT